MSTTRKQVDAQKIHAGSGYGDSPGRVAMQDGWQWVVYGDDGFPIDGSPTIYDTRDEAIAAGRDLLSRFASYDDAARS